MDGHAHRWLAPATISIASKSGRALDDRGYALPSGGAHRDQRPLLHFRRQLLGGEAEDARAGCGKRVAISEARTLGVELAAVDRAHRRVAAEDGAAIVRVF